MPCEFKAHCWAGLSEGSVHHLCFIRDKQRADLTALGLTRIAEIPEELLEDPRQRRHVEAERGGEAIPQIDKVRAYLKKLQYPLYFLDFETVSPAIPFYNGTRPFQKIPFQFSLRVHNEEHELKHIEFLGDGSNDPRPEIAELLANGIGSKGIVIAYNASFEAGILDELAAAFPKHGKALLDAKNRMWDLMIPFMKRFYVHPNFNGSASIKVVLPALIPKMSYEGMEVSDGEQASLTYLDLMSGALTGVEADNARKHLKAYCGQDTLAMVKILDVLRQL